MNMRCTSGAICLTVLFLLPHSEASAAAQPPSQFLWISDIHFDPTANAALTNELADAEVTDWARILNSSPGRAAQFGQDTNWPLLASSLAEIKKTSQSAQFTIVTGDIFVHNFRSKFNQTATKHDDADFRRFAAKTVQFVATELADLVPGKPVLFTLGNNDSDCGDYELQPQGAFLSDTGGAVASMLGPLADDASKSDWRNSGSYSVRHPVLKHYRIIALNSVYFSPKYRNSCATSAASDPASDQMGWLSARLADANVHHEKVWLIFHIAPGLDGYATSHPKNGGSEKPIVPMWNPVYNDKFEKLIERYRNTVTISLAGHEHTDDFRLVNHSLVLLAPGLSPLVGQNPAFRLVTYQSDGKLRDATTYYLSNLNDLGSDDAGADWKAEYNFAQAWHINRLDFKNFNKVYQAVQKSSAMQARWSTLYSVSHPEGDAITPETFPWLFCATGNMTETAYKGCLQRVRP